MNITVRQLAPFVCSLIVAAFLVGCGSLIGGFSEQAYKNATDLKAETVALVRKSTEPYSSNREGVESLLVKDDAAYEYAKGLPNNQLSAAQWIIMRDPNGRFLGRWAVTWRNRGQLSAIFVEELAGQISDSFDTIICLEINKRSATRCGDVGSGNPI